MVLLIIRVTTLIFC